jgi:NAD-dependent dihydropyrimidine dehydrogenase PreA subunit
MIKKHPIIDYSTCTACGVCDLVCPFSCISLSKIDLDKYKKAFPVLISEASCTGCVLCSNACPVDSIHLE